MSEQRLLDWTEFLSCRLIFFSTLDDRRFHGWLIDGKDRSITLRTTSGPPEEIKSGFLFQVFASRHDAFFKAVLMDVQQGVGSLAGITAADYTFHVESTVRLVSVKRAARKLAKDLEVVLKVLPADTHNVSLEDVALSGIGVLSAAELKIGEKATVLVKGHAAEMSLVGVVRNCLSVPSEDGPKWRIGLSVEPGDRISVTSWKKFVDG